MIVITSPTGQIGRQVVDEPDRERRRAPRDVSATRRL